MTSRSPLIGLAALCCLLALAASASLGASAPIPLDTPEPKYQGYFNGVRERIRAKWIHPRAAAESEGELLIEFHIAKDGHLEYVALQRSSGVPLLDTNAMNAVKSSEPFPLVPDGLLSGGSLAISARFRYQIVGSFVNMLLR